MKLILITFIAAVVVVGVYGAATPAGCPSVHKPEESTNNPNDVGNEIEPISTTVNSITEEEPEKDEEEENNSIPEEDEDEETPVQGIQPFITCDLLHPTGWQNSLCAGHCIFKGFKGGWCTNGVCRCRR